MSERQTIAVRKRLIECDKSYVESVGKVDKQTLGRAELNESGEGTVLRLVIGASANIPARALTYVASALQIAEHIPHEQLQIVHAVHVGAAVNKVPIGRSKDEAKRVMRAIGFNVRNFNLSPGQNVIHGFDTPLDLTDYKPLAEEAFATGNPVFKKLSLAGEKHGGDPVLYTAAHRAFHDTDKLEIVPSTMHGSSRQIQAERIISIGAGTERQFYAARMAMQEIEPPEVETAQIFTKHLTPPYYHANGGEQTIHDALLRGVDITKTTDVAARRDIAHYLGTLTTGEIQ